MASMCFLLDVHFERFEIIEVYLTNLCRSPLFVLDVYRIQDSVLLLEAMDKVNILDTSKVSSVGDNDCWKLCSGILGNIRTMFSVVRSSN